MRQEIVHGLWIRGSLSPLEMLTILSYIRRGFQFKLWTYDQPSVYPVMDGLEIKDANLIIPDNQVFSYKHSNQFGHGKGSYAGFSDVFRYKLLYEQGGWWTDMDVTCLKMPDYDAPYLFRYSKRRDHWIVGNIMKVPAGSELMRRCYQEALVINEDNRDWMAPIKILNRNIENLGLAGFAQVISNDDSWPEVSRLTTSEVTVDAHWSFIHWMNEEFRRLEIAKDIYLPETFFGKLMQNYQLGKPILEKKERLKYQLKSGRIYYAFKHFRKQTFLLSLYYLGFNLFYAISDLYFITIKPHFDIGKIFRRLSPKNLFRKS